MKRSARYLGVAATRENVPGAGVPAAKPHDSEVTSYVAPVLVADAGITIGSSPGARSYLGGLLLIEASSQASVPGVRQRHGYTSAGSEKSYGTPAIDVTRGPVVQFGPVLGVVLEAEWSGKFRKRRQHAGSQRSSCHENLGVRALF